MEGFKMVSTAALYQVARFHFLTITTMRIPSSIERIPPSTMSTQDASEPKRRIANVAVLGLCLLTTTTMLLYNNVGLLQDYYKLTPAPLTEESVIVVTHDLLPAPVPNQSSVSVPAPDKVRGRPKPKLKFFIAGFPKCGTTTLVHALAAHNETDISLEEKCYIGGAAFADGPAYASLVKILRELSPDPDVKLGFKCPIGLRNHRILDRLHRHDPQTSFIIGVRHPVRLFESHYNYRITEIHDRKEITPIPAFESLTDGNEWRGVGTDNYRFDLFMSQLGKTNMTPQDIDELDLRPHMGVIPNSFKVFLYSLEQMEDKNKTRLAGFRDGLKTYLDLKQPIEPFGHENLNRYVGKTAHKETIDICESKYDELRKKLVLQGQASQTWIRDKFIKSPDVTVPNKDHFLRTLKAWGTDPCSAGKK